MQTTRDKILQSLQPVVSDSKFVRIKDEAIERLADELKNEVVPPWDNHLQLLGTSAETLQYYFFVDSINCCFWAPKGQERWSYEVNGEWISGYYAFSAAIKDAFLRDKRLFDSTYLAQISEADFKAIFKGKNELLLVDERLSIIRENFSILNKKFDGSAQNLLEQAKGDVDTFVTTILENFPTFRDEVVWEGKPVYFWKRVQIFPSDLSFALPDMGSIGFKNLENLTIFADYKLPQILEAFGALEYAPELLSDITEERLIPAGSQKEIEIRANTIVAIEKLAEALRAKGGNFSTHEVDWILWVKAKQTKLPRPHHKTLTIFY